MINKTTSFSRMKAALISLSKIKRVVKSVFTGFSVLPPLPLLFSYLLGQQHKVLPTPTLYLFPHQSRGLLSITTNMNERIENLCSNSDPIELYELGEVTSLLVSVSLLIK